MKGVQSYSNPRPSNGMSQAMMRGEAPALCCFPQRHLAPLTNSAIYGGDGVYPIPVSPGFSPKGTRLKHL